MDGDMGCVCLPKFGEGKKHIQPGELTMFCSLLSRHQLYLALAR